MRVGRPRVPPLLLSKCGTAAMLPRVCAEPSCLTARPSSGSIATVAWEFICPRRGVRKKRGAQDARRERELSGSPRGLKTYVTLRRSSRLTADWSCRSRGAVAQLRAGIRGSGSSALPYVGCHSSQDRRSGLQQCVEKFPHHASELFGPRNRDAGRLNRVRVA